MPHRARRLVAAVVFVLSALTAPGRAGMATAGNTDLADAAGIVWLCRPGMADDPCTANLTATSVRGDGTTSAVPAGVAVKIAIDCFYVYPTVSLERSVNADLTAQPAETSVAVEQAARFSQVCRVWAPMYRQRTLLSLALGMNGSPAATATAYDGVLAGWRDYLAHYNDGRPIVFIGHSQGATMLILLLRSEVDSNAALRNKLVSAILLGGNVTVSSNSTSGGSFHHIPACRSSQQYGCVIAYSSFPGQPPANSWFGRPGQGVSLQAGQTATSSALQVLCVNPAALGGGTGSLNPYFLASTVKSGRAVSTPWVTYPKLYTGSCRSAGGATWLQVTDIASATDGRTRMRQVGGPRWGYHVSDVNLALGNLVQDVGAQAVAYARAHRR